MAFIFVAGCTTAIPERQVQTVHITRSAPPLPPLPPADSAGSAKIRAIAPLAASGHRTSTPVGTATSTNTLKLLSSNNADTDFAYPWALVAWTLSDPAGNKNNVMFTNLTARVIYSVECCEDGTNWMAMGWYHQVQEFGGKKNLGLTLIDRHPERAARWRLRLTPPQRKMLSTLVQSTP